MTNSFNISDLGFDDMVFSDVSSHEPHVKKALVRDIKLKLLSIDFNSISVDDSRFRSLDKNYLYELNMLTDVGVSCGSLSLHLYGLLDRNPGDIDLLVDKSSEFVIEHLNNNRQSINRYVTANSSFCNNVDGFVPVAQFKRNGILIDMFHDIKVNYKAYKNIKIQNPIDVLYKKFDIFLSVNRDKDYDDLVNISRNLDRFH